MYVPIMKNRAEELRVSKACVDFFSDSLIPMYEIIQDKYTPKFEIDDSTGEYKYEIKPGNKKKTKIKLPPEEKDIITLENLNELIGGKKAFIDFFRFFEKEYGNRDFKNIETSFHLSRNFNDYRKRLLQLAKYENFIPTISIKEGLFISEYDLTMLIGDLRKSEKSIALRITTDCIEKYASIIEEKFTAEDYIMLDIREDNVVSKEIEIDDFMDIDFFGTKILLNSHRKKEILNKDFENLRYTDKIDNSLSQKYSELKFDGFGDFGGLKDDLPVNAGSNGTGAALALLYFKNSNKFYSIVNLDTSLGAKGYAYVKGEVLNMRNIIDPHNNCLAMAKIDSINNGSFASWNNINLTRYIHQQAKK